VSLRVVETFGPTVQGEGPHAGRVCHFLRLGGCDFRCSWCDTPHAVFPDLVRQAPALTVPEVLDRLESLPPAPMLVISGGNPALWDLERLLDLLAYDIVGVETQGSRWKPWLGRVDSLVVSPKPPSSGMVSAEHDLEFDAFMDRALGHAGLVLKMVAFDERDLDWALGVHQRYPSVPLYLSAGTDQAVGDHAVLDAVGNRYAWLCETVARRPELHAAVVLPQLHVVAWGNAIGV
jgi:7-carboxy-7-deazaguanine synthase